MAILTGLTISGGGITISSPPPPPSGAGYLYYWGMNVNGSIPNQSSNYTQYNSPIVIGSDTNWIAVSASLEGGAGVKTDGTLWTWGKNTAGQLGDNTTINKSSPVQTVAGGTNWSQVSMTVAAQNNDSTVAAIKTDGTLWLWGENLAGSLGDNTTIKKSSPVQTVAGGSNWSKITTGTAVSGRIAVGAIKTDGTLWMWGWNNYSNLGTTSTGNKSSPTQTVSAGSNWAEISTGPHATAAIKTDGTLWVWGANYNGVFGTNNTIGTFPNFLSSPVQTVAAGTNWSKVATGYDSVAAIKTDGTLWTWGRNNQGQLGNGNTTNQSSPAQINGGGTNWSQASMGLYYSSAAIKTDGTLWTWGDGEFGQIGDNSTLDRLSPVQTIAGGTNWTQVSASGFNTAAIRSS